MADESTMYTALTAWASCAAVACAFIVMWSQNRSAKRLTCLQLFIQLAAQYDSADMNRIRSKVARKLISNPTALDIEDSILVYFENLAILYRKQFLDEHLVWNTFSHDVPRYWHAVKHYVAHSRISSQDPSLYEEFEKLCSVFESSGRSPQGTSLPPRNINAQDCSDFLQSESLRGG